MNDEQRKVVEQLSARCLEEDCLDWIDELKDQCLSELEWKNLIPKLVDEDDTTSPQLVLEIEKLIARTMIQAAIKFLQNRQEAFPEHASPKLAIVEIDYDDQELDEYDEYEGIFVRKVVVDGKEIHDDPLGPFDTTRVWLLIENEAAALGLERRLN